MVKTVLIAADGGCRGNGKKTNVGGYGVVMEYVDTEGIVHTKELKAAEFDTTNNIQELKSCIVGLSAIKDKNVNIELYSDSKYVNDGITKWINGWKKNGWKTASKQPVKNKELWIQLDALVNSFSNLRFIWVKGHADHRLNIRADQLANEAMDEITNEK